MSKTKKQLNSQPVARTYFSNMNPSDRFVGMEVKSVKLRGKGFGKEDGYLYQLKGVTDQGESVLLADCNDLSKLMQATVMIKQKLGMLVQ